MKKLFKGECARCKNPFTSLYKIQRYCKKCSRIVNVLRKEVCRCGGLKTIGSKQCDKCHRGGVRTRGSHRWWRK